MVRKHQNSGLGVGASARVFGVSKSVLARWVEQLGKKGRKVKNGRVRSPERRAKALANLTPGYANAVARAKQAGISTPTLYRWAREARKKAGNGHYPVNGRVEAVACLQDAKTFLQARVQAGRMDIDDPILVSVMGALTCLLGPQ